MPEPATSAPTPTPQCLPFPRRKDTLATDSSSDAIATPLRRSSAAQDRLDGAVRRILQRRNPGAVVVPVGNEPNTISKRPTATCDNNLAQRRGKQVA